MQRPTTPLIFTAFLFVVAIMSSAFSNARPTCKNFILNTYLYVGLSFLVIAFAATHVDLVDTDKTIASLGGLFAIFICTLLIIFAIHATSNVFLSHVLWVLFSILLGMILYPAIQQSSSDTISMALIGTIIMMLIFCGIVFFKPDLVSLSWGSTLLVCLIVVLVVMILNIFIGNRSSSKVISGIVLLLFSFFLMYDTKRIMVLSKQCDITTSPPNYPKESMGFILDALNIFVSLMNLQSF